MENLILKQDVVILDWDYTRRNRKEGTYNMEVLVENSEFSANLFLDMLVIRDFEIGDHDTPPSHEDTVKLDVSLIDVWDDKGDEIAFTPEQIETIINTYKNNLEYE